MAKKDITLSIALAVHNEAENIARCLESVKGLADEIVVVDGGSTDATREIAKQYNATVIETDNPPVFHINKQKALEASGGTWILQMDADEAVTPELAREIRSVIREGADADVWAGITPDKQRLFRRHQEAVEARDGKFGTGKGEVAAYFIARRNYFLGKPMRYAGMYPDGVIRLVKNGKARFPARSVHEQIEIDGRVAWLAHDLLHYSNPTFARYMQGARKYTDLLADELSAKKTGTGPGIWVTYCLFLPAVTFFRLYIRHKGILDGYHGFLFSLFSALHYPWAFIRYANRQSHQ